jgi:hypothetical protein
MPEQHLQDVLGDTFDKMVAEDSVTDEPEVVEATAEIEDVAEVEISEEETEETVEVDETEEVAAQSDEGEEEVVEEEPVYDEPAPERWSPEMKDSYEALPPEAKQMMLDGVFKPMQRQYTETTTELAQMKQQIAPLLETMEQYSGDFERAGMTPAEGIKRQAAWASHFLKVGNEQGMRDMAESFGVKGVDSGQDRDEYMTPTERRQQTQIDGLQNTINNQTTSAQEQRQINAQNARVGQARNEIQSFANEQKDGKPAHPFIEQVAPQIAGILRGGLVTRTDEYGQQVPFKSQIAQAYKMACDMNPKIRTASNTGSKKRQVARAKAAQDVGVVATVPAGDVSGMSSKSLAGNIEDNYDILDKRVG